MQMDTEPRSPQSRESLVPIETDRVVVGSFDAFYLAEFPRMVALGTALTGDPALTEELAQEAMLRTYRHWPKVTTYDRPGAWTRRVTMNLAFSAKARRRAESDALTRIASEHTATTYELGDAAEFWAVVRRLPRRQCAAVTLYYLEDWAIADIAAALGCSENTAKGHLFKGRNNLARLLDTEVE